MIEEWRPVAGYEDLYSISNKGRVRGEKRYCKTPRGTRTVPSRILSITKPTRTNKYPTITLWRYGIPVKFRIHDLVAPAFFGPRPTGMEVLHWDDDPLNNNATNLRYGTHAENKADGVRNRKSCRQGHRWTLENTYIRQDTGTRQCRQCQRDRKANRFKPDPKSPIQCNGKA